MTYWTKYDDKELMFNNEREVFKAGVHRVNESRMNNTYGESEALLELCLETMSYYDRGIIGPRNCSPQFENAVEFFDYLDRNCKNNGKIKYIYYPLIREEFLNLLKEKNFEDLFALVDKNTQIAQSIAPNYNQDGYLIFVPNPFSSHTNDFYWGQVSNTYDNRKKWIPISVLRDIPEIQFYVKE